MGTNGNWINSCTISNSKVEPEAKGIIISLASVKLKELDKENTGNNNQMKSDVRDKCSSLLQQIIDMDESVNFRDPVDWNELGLNDYPEIIKTPMDISTIKQKLSRNEYISTQDFKMDFDLSKFFTYLALCICFWIGG